MSAADEIMPSGDKMKKTLCWISEMLQAHPEINVVLSMVVLLMNLLVDVTYAWMDPRVQYR